MILFLLTTWLILSITVGTALGQFLQKCEDNECQLHTAPSPTTAPTAQDAR